MSYYDTSYPPQALSNWNPATGATAGIPGSWTPAGATPPKDPVALSQGKPETVVASPATAWTSGQYVQTATAGAAGRATWTGTAWVGGAAPLEADTTENEFGAPIPVSNLPNETEGTMSNDPTPDDVPPDDDQPTPEQPA